jgi:hypothetical protein
VPGEGRRHPLRAALIILAIALAGLIAAFGWLANLTLGMEARVCRLERQALDLRADVGALGEGHMDLEAKTDWIARGLRLDH